MSRLPRKYADGMVLGLYLAITLYLMARVLPQFGSAIPGAGLAQEDGWQNTWNLWWTRLALARGQNPYYTNMLFYPTGASLYLHTLNITNGLLTLPVQLIGGPVAAYNGAVIVGFVPSGYGTYLRALHLIGDRVSACAAGAIFSFGPFHLTKLWDGHLSWVTVQWIPFFLLFLLLALEGARWRMRVLAGLFLAIAALTSWYYGLFSAIFVGLLVLVRLPGTLREGRWRSELTTFVAVAAVAGLLLAPVLLPALNEHLNGPEHLAGPQGDRRWDSSTGLYSADVLDILYPSFLHPLWGGWSERTHTAMRVVWFWNGTPGFGVLALAAIGCLARWRQARPWLALVVVLWIFSLGPQLRVAGVRTGLPLPYELLNGLPGMTLGHRPNHIVIFMLPLLAVLAGFGVQALGQRGRAGLVALVLLASVVLVEYAVLPLPTLPLGVPQAVFALQGQPGAVVDLPRERRTAGAMNNQMIHGRPITGGYLAREPDPPPFIASVPWVRRLGRSYSEDAPDIIAPRPDDGRQAFSYYDLRTIIVRRNELSAAEDEDLRRVLAQVLPGVMPTYSSPNIAVYAVPLVAPRPFVFLGEGWQEPEQAAGRVWRWMGSRATLRVVNPQTTACIVKLELSAESYLRPRPLDVTLDGHRVGSFATPGNGQQSLSMQLTLELVLPPGEHTLGFSSQPEPEQGRGARDLSLAFTSIQLLAAP